MPLLITTNFILYAYFWINDSADYYRNSTKAATKVRKWSSTWMPNIFFLVDVLVQAAAIIRIFIMVHKQKDFKVKKRYMLIHLFIVILLASVTFLSTKTWKSGKTT